MEFILFLLLSAVAIAGAITMILHPHPVTSALSLAVSFLAVAGLYIQLEAELMGIFQILVYAGAIMVLFLFIIMLLDVKNDAPKQQKLVPALCAGLVAALFLIQLGAVLLNFESGKDTFQPLDPESAVSEELHLPTTNEQLAKGSLPDANLLGEALIGTYLLPLQMLGVLLLIASIGVVMLTKRHQNLRQDPDQSPTDPTDPSKLSKPTSDPSNNQD